MVKFLSKQRLCAGEGGEGVKGVHYLRRIERRWGV
jgi:hypothetical protein